MTDDDKRLERVRQSARDYGEAKYRFVPVARDDLDWLLSEFDSAHAEIERLKAQLYGPLHLGDPSPNSPWRSYERPATYEVSGLACGPDDRNTATQEQIGPHTIKVEGCVFDGAVDKIEPWHTTTVSRLVGPDKGDG